MQIPDVTSSSHSQQLRIMAGPSIARVLVTVFLLCISTVISNCPPDSDIYLSYDGVCYPNGSYFQDDLLDRDFNNGRSLSCVLPNTALTTGEWSGPTGSVDCDSSSNSDPLRCNTVTSPDATLRLYLPNGQGFSQSADGFYSCCLPTDCSTAGTNIITANIFRWGQIADITVDLPSNVTVLPQQYTLHAIRVGATGFTNADDWYYVSGTDNTELTNSSCSGQSGYSCTIIGKGDGTTDYTLNVTWNGENITSGVLSQSNNNGDHVYRFNLNVGISQFLPVDRNRMLTVTAPGFTPSSLTLVNKTATTITVSWSPDPSDADGYVVNVTSDTDTVLRTQQVEGGDQSTITLEELSVETTYNITIRAYQQLLGPASDAISVQTLPVITSINWTLVSSITELNNTQYRIDCNTTAGIDPTTDVYWLVNGVRMSSSMYTSIDALTYENTLLVYPDPLGVSVNVTCIAMTGGVDYSDTVILQAPSGPPLNVRAFILSADTIRVNWTTLSQRANGYLIVSVSGTGTRSVLSTTDIEIIIQSLPLSTYTISVYSFRDLPSVNSTQTVLRFDVPSPVTSLSVTAVSVTDITVNWTIPSTAAGNFVTYYVISYTLSCPELSSVNVTVPVTPHQSTTVYSYRLGDLYSGMNYTITVRAGNVLGVSTEAMTREQTSETVPTSRPESLSLSQSTVPVNNLTWSEVNCTQLNGRLIVYTVMISNSSITYNLTSTERYIIVNDLVFGTVYSMSVAAVNSAGSGPFSDPIEVEIGIVPGPVGSVSSIMDTTWAVISWSIPSYIPIAYPIITYEIGYHVLQSDNCSLMDTDSINTQLMIQLSNVSSNNVSTNITGLTANTCYLFGVRAYTSNGYGQWTVTANDTLELPPQPTTSAVSTVVPTSSVSTSNTPPAPQTGSSIGAVAGGAAGGIIVAIIVIIIIILVVAIVLKKRGQTSDKVLISDTKQPNSYPLLDQKVPSTEPDYEPMKAPFLSPAADTQATDIYTTISQEPTYANVTEKSHNNVTSSPPTFDPLIPCTCPVAIGDLGTHVASFHNENNAGFSQQYQELISGEDMPCTVGFSEQNKPFNRFKNIAPYDGNMIVLQQYPTLEKCQREYINATYVDGYSSARKFIAAQGPMKKTLVDFWRLIWQEKPVSIVMVTNLKEGAKSKCEQYWPNSRMESEEFGPFTVTLLDEQILPDFVVRSITVMIQDGSNQSHTLTQYHLTSWPDHGVPDYATPLMILHRQSTKSWSPSKGPILVHCSAGVGRTGTFIAVDIALEQARKEGTVDIAGIVNRLRQQRMKMVQTLDQYVFLHDAVLEAVICGETELPTDKFISSVKKLKRRNPSTHTTGIESQFNLLFQVTPNPNDVFCNSAKAHQDKNRSKQYLPPDKFLVSLREANGYINASYLNGYREKKAFIIAQSPMENTVRDFWKMIMDYKVSAIVMLCGPDEDCCYPYWTTPGDVHVKGYTYGEYTIEVVNDRGSNGYIERMFKVSSEKESKNVLQLQVTDWPEDGIVREPRTILQVMDDVIHRQQKIGGGPVVVHCSDTVSRSGVYCSVSIALEQCKAEGVVDVFQVTKAVRRSKPGAVTTLEQYTSIYDVIDMFLQLNSTYGNFQ